MFVIRPIKRQDLDTLERFALDATGIMSLPKSRQRLKMKLELSIQAFASQIDHPENEGYLFVLEETESEKVAGVCGITSKTGVDEPLYFYHIETLHIPPSNLRTPSKMLLLHPFSLQDGPSEVGSLYLAPEFRKAGVGRLLSLSRFLFMAAFPQRFEDIFIAEMRGYIDENQDSPFWDNLGRHFLHLEFPELIKLLDQGKAFIKQILPHYPIYVALLPKPAQDSISKVHINTRPALNMLLQEGFFMTDEIDPFDGGPQIRASRKEIRTIQNCHSAQVGQLTTHPIQSKPYLVCNTQLDFRACQTYLDFDQQGNAILIKSVADALNIKEGNTIRYVLTSPTPKEQP